MKPFSVTLHVFKNVRKTSAKVENQGHQRIKNLDGDWNKIVKTPTGSKVGTFCEFNTHFMTILIFGGGGSSWDYWVESCKVKSLPRAKQPLDAFFRDQAAAETQRTATTTFRRVEKKVNLGSLLHQPLVPEIEWAAYDSSCGNQWKPVSWPPDRG